MGEIFRINSDGSRSTTSEPKAPSSQKVASDASIYLIPKPSTDIRDPLNWPKQQKTAHFIAIAFLCFICVATGSCNLLAYPTQVRTYNLPVTYMTYGASAHLSGTMVGPLLLFPVSRALGRPAVLFWACLAVLATQVWAATTTSPNDYISYIMSRLFSGIFSSFPGAIAPAYIMELFFLHQRGRLFTILEMVYLFGTFMPSTMSGFIVANARWTWCFWWTVPPLALAALLVFLFVEETNFNRAELTCVRASRESWVRNRWETFIVGWRTVPAAGRRASAMGRQIVGPLQIAVAPVSIVPGLFTCVAFGFNILKNIQSTIWIQKPVVAGGYGYSPITNAYFTFAPWVSVLAALATGHLLGDRLPLWLAKKRNNGVWQPEFRLVNILIPAILLPIGLGLFGACLQYTYHPAALVFSTFLVSYAAVFTIPLCINYACECFVSRGTEVGIAFNIWRSLLAVFLNFAVQPWEHAVGIGWTFGMAAFLVLFFGVAAVVMGIFGGRVREMSWGSKGDSEGGERIGKGNEV